MPVLIDRGCYIVQHVNVLSRGKLLYQAGLPVCESVDWYYEEEEKQREDRNALCSSSLTVNMVSHIITARNRKKYVQ